MPPLCGTPSYEKLCVDRLHILTFLAFLRVLHGATSPMNTSTRSGTIHFGKFAAMLAKKRGGVLRPLPAGAKLQPSPAAACLKFGDKPRASIGDD